MSDRRDLIVVVGMPSGGTSLVAGLLHHLGVDMGRVAEGVQPGARQYEGFECLDCWEGGITGAFDPAAAQQFMASVVSYCDARRAAATGPVGVKHNPLVWLGMFSGIGALPIRLVHVRRPLDDVMRSDRRYRGDDLGRAGRMGMHWLAMQRLLEQVPPSATLDFGLVRESPAAAIATLVDALALAPGEEQVAGARAFVVPPSPPAPASMSA
jgi:hypothetical protein